MEAEELMVCACQCKKRGREGGICNGGEEGWNGRTEDCGAGGCVDKKVGVREE